MTTVLRLKRLLSEDPADAIVVHTKRLKGEDGNKHHEESTSPTGNVTLTPKYFTLIGTIKEAENDKIQELILKTNAKKSSLSVYSEWRENSSKERVKSFKSRPKVSDGAKRQAQLEASSQKKRLKLVHCSRVGGAEDSSSDVDATTQSLYKLYDVIEEQAAVESDERTKCLQKPVISCNGVPFVATGTKNTSETAYDLYYASTSDVGDIDFLDEVVSLRVEKCLLEEEAEQCAGLMAAGVSSDEGDEDSNDENNWKNDYPDEDDDFEKEYDYYRDYDDDEEEILDMIHSCNMKDDELNGSTCSEVLADPTDRDGYDYRYSRYKEQMMRELEEYSSSDDSSA